MMMVAVGVRVSELLNWAKRAICMIFPFSFGFLLSFQGMKNWENVNRVENQFKILKTFFVTFELFYIILVNKEIFHFRWTTEKKFIFIVR